ncbi:MAG TPA: cytochrome P450 [Quisquiliibacterium sp.]|nr:cytochrome P450 [Quisquiliibacterium sp.]
MTSTAAASTTVPATGAPSGDPPPASGRAGFLAAGDTPFWLRMPEFRDRRTIDTGSALILLRPDDCAAILRDARFTQWNMAQVERNPQIDPRFVERRRQAFLSMEGLDHLRLRRLAMVALTPAAMNAQRARMRALMDRLIDPVIGAGRMDAVKDVIVHYPLPVICGVLGVPDEDIPFFARTAEDWVRWMWGGPAAVPAALAAHDAMDAYMTGLIARRAQALGDDVISGLIRAELEGDRLTREEVIHTAASLIVPGLETTYSTLGSGLYLFTQHPEQWALLARDPSLIPSAVEEILRFAPVGPTLERIANEDAQVNGLHIARDTHVVLALASVNRDPELFPDPDRFDVTRTPQRGHMTFGGGRHLCLGMHMARAELQEGLGCLVRRLARIELDGPVTWSAPLGFQGPRALPVRFTARA